MGVESKEERARGKKGKDDNGIFRREGRGRRGDGKRGGIVEGRRG